jgi:hypothetical protein
VDPFVRFFDSVEERNGWELHLGFDSGSFLLELADLILMVTNIVKVGGVV